MEVSTGRIAHVIDWSAVSGLGIGRDDFVRGFLTGESGTVGCLLAGFDPTTLIGIKGTRTLDRMTSLVIATAGMVLDAQPGGAAGRAPLGLVLGTSTGSVASIVDFTRDTFVRERPYLVNPALFPNTVMNGAAGRTAIWYGLRGPNSTIAAGHLTGLVVLRYATRMLRLGYADRLLVGAVEEVSEEVSVAAATVGRADVTAAGGGLTPLGEGCVVFLIDGRAGGDGAAAEIVDFEFGVAEVGTGAQSAGLARTIRSLLTRTGIRPDDLWLVSLAQSGDGTLDEAELTAVDEALGGPGVGRRVVASERTGNAFSALGAFQLAAALALAADADQDDSRTRPCLLTSLGVDGSVGCALVRL